MTRGLRTCCLFAALVAVGCAAESREQAEYAAPRVATERPTLQPVADTAGSWLAQAAAAHAAADAALADGRAEDARRRLRELADQPMTGAANGSAQVLQVRRATFARLAELEIVDAPPRALSTAQSGLALDERPDVITAELHFWRGRAYEALGDTAAAEREFALCRDAAKSLSAAP